MTKYKNTYIIEKNNGSSYSATDASMMISGFSVKSNVLATGKKVSAEDISYTGIIKLTDEALNTIDLPVFDGRSIGRESNESYDVHNGISTRNIRTNVSSCMLMHANPKLTGNVKIVVDSKSNLYIDTFKVNDSMSKRKYRHVPISYKDYYGNNIMSVFKDVTSNDFYDIPEKYRRMFTVAQNYNEQYVDIYRYGASTNRDNLYKESLSILAPLKVGKIMPDFFIIFRVNGGVDESKSSIDTLTYLLKNGEQIAFFDFREGSHLGTYIRNIYEQSKDFVGYVYDSREDQNTNIINGISLDRGVATSAHESTSFSVDFSETDPNLEDVTQTLKDVTQTSINEYYTRGYERNRLVAPDLVNFEFMFNDDTDQFSINTYFGIYVTENDIRSNFYVNGTYIDDTGKIKIKFSDNKESLDTRHDSIHAYISNDNFIRTNKDTEYDKLKGLKNKFGNNVLSLPVKEMDTDMQKYKYYMSFTVHDILSHGEHLRVILHQSNSILDATSTIYEVVLSNNNEYLKNKHHISEDSIVYKEFDYNNGILNNRKVIIHRIAVSLGITRDDVKELLDSFKKSKDEIVSEDELFFRFEMDAIYHAFRSFDDAKFESVSLHDGTISIGIFDTELTSDCYEFQRITGNVVYNTKNKEKLLDEDDTEAKKVTYFGENVVPLMVVDPLDRESAFYREDDEQGRLIAYTPYNYEILGPRQMNVVQFININNITLYELNPVDISEHVLHDQLVAVTENNEIVDYEPFVLSYRTMDDNNMTYDTVNINIISSVYRSNLMMAKGYSQKIKHSYINLYEPYLLSESVCGIIPIKDFDTYVTHNEGEQKPYDEYDTNFVNLNYAKDNQGHNAYLDFDAKHADLDYCLKTWYEDGIRNSIGALTTPSIVKWEAAATEAGPVYTEYIIPNGVYYVIKHTTDEDDMFSVDDEHAYYRWRRYDPSEEEKISASSLLTELRTYENETSTEYYTKAYSIAAEIHSDGENPHLYDIESKFKIIKTSTETIPIDGVDYDYLILTKVPSTYTKRIQSNGSFAEDSQSTTKYLLSKYRDVTPCERTQEYNIIHMNQYVRDVTMRDALINGKITIEDIITQNMPNNITVDSVDEYTLKFMLDGIIRSIKIGDTTTLSMSNYKNFNIYLAKSEYCGNDNDIEVFIDTINRDILLVWYALMDNVMYYGNGISLFGDDKFREIPTDYKERDIHIKDNKIYLGDEELDPSDNIILYTDNIQISYQPLSSDGNKSIVLYNSLGYNYSNNDNSQGYTINPCDYDLNRICKDNKVTKYKVEKTNTIDPDANAKDLKCSTFVRDTEEGYNNYTNAVNMSISSDVQTITTDYAKMWFSPVLLDWVTFGGTVSEGVFTKTYFMNIAPVSMVETIPMYYNKVTNINDYSVHEGSYRISIGRNYNHKSMMNSFSRKYNILTSISNGKDKNTYVGGFTTGTIDKTYLNSIALNTRKNDISDILLTIWNGVSLRGGKIYFNITSSLVNHIMSMGGYSKSWSYYKDSRYTDMKKFIYDSILPYLTIDSKSELVVYFQKGARTTGSTTKPPRATKIDNVKREVIKRNGEYYVVLTPDMHKVGTYYITFKVTQ